MRQAGMKPKSRKSGVHQVRLAAKQDRTKHIKQEKPMSLSAMVVVLLIIIAPFMLLAFIFHGLKKLAKTIG